MSCNDEFLKYIDEVNKLLEGDNMGYQPVRSSKSEPPFIKDKKPFNAIKILDQMLADWEFYKKHGKWREDVELEELQKMDIPEGSLVVRGGQGNKIRAVLTKQDGE